MRQDEICRVLIEDHNQAQSTLLIRQRKHPRQKAANDQVIPLVADAWSEAPLYSRGLSRYRDKVSSRRRVTGGAPSMK